MQKRVRRGEDWSAVFGGAVTSLGFLRQLGQRQEGIVDPRPQHDHEDHRRRGGGGIDRLRKGLPAHPDLAGELRLPRASFNAYAVVAYCGTHGTEQILLATDST